MSAGPLPKATEDREASERKKLRLAIALGMLGGVLMLIQLARGVEPVVTSVLAVLFFAMSGGTLWALRRRLWSVWEPEKIQKSRALVLVVGTWVGGILFLVWGLLVIPSASAALSWWGHALIFSVGAILFSGFCYLGYRRLVRIGLIE